MVRVLIVEDERKLAQVLSSALQAEHYDVVVAATGEDGFYRANAELFDLVVLDLMLPGRSGLEILQTLRQRRIETPVLILTARDGLDDRVLGLDLGADDYLVKPFALPELLARIRALLRRGRPSDVFRLKVADLEVDLVARRVVRGDRLIDLTAREFELLEYLLRHQGHLVSREMLARDVWKEPRRATPLDNVIDVQIARLRRKGRSGRRCPPDSHRARRRLRHAGRRTMTRWWSTASIRRQADRLVQRRARTDAGRLCGRDLRGRSSRVLRATRAGAARRAAGAPLNARAAHRAAAGRDPRSFWCLACRSLSVSPALAATCSPVAP